MNGKYYSFFSIIYPQYVEKHISLRFFPFIQWLNFTLPQVWKSTNHMLRSYATNRVSKLFRGEIWISEYVLWFFLLWILFHDPSSFGKAKVVQFLLVYLEPMLADRVAQLDFTLIYTGFIYCLIDVTLTIEKHLSYHTIHIRIIKLEISIF